MVLQPKNRHVPNDGLGTTLLAIKRDLTLLKCLVGISLAGVMALVLKAFFNPAS